MDFQQFKKKYQQTEVDHYPNKVPDDVLVSVLVQTYNHEKYIAQCLDSIIAQETDFLYEILIGEDNSKDLTRKICLEYAQNYPDKIRLFLHYDDNKIKVDSIQTGNFNAFYNLYSARGKYIAFCEGDDYWQDKNKLQLQTKCLINSPNSAFCYHNFEERTSKQVLVENSLDQPRFNITSQNLIELKYHPQLSTVCFHNIIRNFPQEMMEVINVDSFLIILLGEFGPARFLPEIKPNVYRRNNSGIWTKNTKKQKLQVKARSFKKIADYYFKSGNKTQAEIFNLYCKNAYRSLFLQYVKNFEIFNAYKIFGRATGFF